MTLESRLRREAYPVADFVCVDLDPWGNRYLPDSPDAGEWTVFDQVCPCGRRVVVVALAIEDDVPLLCNGCAAVAEDHDAERSGPR